MEYIDVEGTTQEEALRRARDKLGTSDFRWEPVSRPHPSLPARIRVWLEPKEVKEAKEVIGTILKLMGAKGELEFTFLGRRRWRININTRSWDSVLIGKGGETLEALQHIVNLIFRRKKIRMDVELDVAGYKERQLTLALNKALAVAVRVKETGKEMTLDPMPPDKRRLVRDVLRRDPEIRVYTAGRGPEIYLVVAPRKREKEEGAG